MTVSEKLRSVQGLHSHAEMFGFNWNDGSDWTWHDVACKIADEIDAENAKLRKERDYLLMNSNPTATELRRVRSAWKKDRDENDQLKSENAKLREELESVGTAAYLYGRTDLADENAKLFALLKHESEQTEKLRELVRFIMRQCNDGNPRCDECIEWNDGECVALLRMRELGIEVN